MNFLASRLDVLQDLFPDETKSNLVNVLDLADASLQTTGNLKNQDFPKRWNSGEGLRSLIFSIIVLKKPDYFVETGTANGFSAAAACSAFSYLGKGHVFSFDVLESEAKMVPQEYRKFLTLRRFNPDSSSLSQLLSELDLNFDNSVFFHDGDHSYMGQKRDYLTAKNNNFCVLLSDDVDTSLAFCDVFNSHGNVSFDAPKMFGYVKLHEFQT